MWGLPLWSVSGMFMKQSPSTTPIPTYDQPAQHHSDGGEVSEWDAIPWIHRIRSHPEWIQPASPRAAADHGEDPPAAEVSALAHEGRPLGLRLA
jgi:hypothetical protein